MAARRLVSTISRPARAIFLQHLRKSPNVNSVYRSLLNSAPKNPKYQNPDGFGSTSTKARPFSTEAGSDPVAECRRRLGIGDAPVLHQVPQAPWLPPRLDEIKINFCGTVAEDHFDHPGDKTGTLVAAARNSAGDLLGVTTGPKIYNELGSRDGCINMQMYALKAAANLAKELENTVTHIGPVVYETSHITVAGCFAPDEKFVNAFPREEFLREIMPPDEEFEEVGRSCPIYCGCGDGLRVTVPEGFFDFHRWDGDKALSGGCCFRTIRL